MKVVKINVEPKSELTKEVDRLERLSAELLDVNARLVDALRVIINNGGIGPEQMFDDARDAISASSRAVGRVKNKDVTIVAGEPRDCPRCQERITDRNYLLFERDPGVLEMCDPDERDWVDPEYMCITCYDACIEERP